MSPPRTREKRPSWIDAVERVVKAIPRGEVLSYSQVALRAGMPGNPRGVVRALKQIKNAPWWRVIRADGTVAPEMADSQLGRLAREGHEIRGRRVRPTRSQARAAPGGKAAKTPRRHSNA